MKRRAEEKRQREEEQAQKAAAEEREREARAQAAERELRISQKMAWRRYARRMLVPEEIPGSKTGVRIGIRMPSGRLLVRWFESSNTVTSLYAFVASQFIPPGDDPENDPLEPPSGGGFGTGVEDHDWDWDFRLAVAFPKSVIVWTKGDQTKIGEVAALKGGGNLVVEMQKPKYDDHLGVKEVEDDDDETASEDSE